MECLMVTFAFREMTMQQFAGIVFGIFRNNKHAEQFVGNESENIIHFTNEILYFLGILSGALSLPLAGRFFFRPFVGWFVFTNNSRCIFIVHYSVC
jgi:glucan phosphoethanolaminetransferase (alkaline phosphatase superfamily)